MRQEISSVNDCFILVDAADHTLLAFCTRYPFIHDEGNARAFALFAEADDSFENISNQIIFHDITIKCIKMFNLE